MPNCSSLEGKRFGKLVVVEKTGERQDGYWVWRCRCDCGGEILANTKRLKRGTITNCGCVPKNTARNGNIPEDLTGQRFGHLTVLRAVPNRNGRRHWECRCDCGKIHVVSAHNLKAGKVKSCGCQQYQTGVKGCDITNQRFGRLTALYPTEKRDGKGSVVWHCRCDCGKELDLAEGALVHGNYRSCGCLREEYRKNINKQLHLIDGTCIEWLEKRKYRSDNTSGFRGVYPLKNGKFRVSIGFKRQRFHIGIFSSFQEAVQARLDAEKVIHEGCVDAYRRWKEQGEETPFVFEVIKTENGFQVYSNVK